MKKQKFVSKRQVRDGSPAAKRKRPPRTAGVADGGRPVPATRKGKDSVSRKSAATPFKAAGAVVVNRAAPAAKLTVRTPNKEIQRRSKELKERRFDMADMEPMRLQKALSSSGVGSRREMDDWIGQGLVFVNGKAAEPGTRITPEDKVTIRGKPVHIRWPDRLPRILLYYKQEGEIVSRNDPGGRISVFDRLPAISGSRWIAVGRLDINTSGLLILTTSGELANRFAHPGFEVEREYAVRVLGSLTDDQKRLLCTGIMLEDGEANVERITEEGGEGANRWYNIVLKEGRNREVRRLFEAMELTVSRLVRVRFGPIGLPSRLKRGQYYELNRFEVANILNWAGMAVPGTGMRFS